MLIGASCVFVEHMYPPPCILMRGCEGGVVYGRRFAAEGTRSVGHGLAFGDDSARWKGSRARTPPIMINDNGVGMLCCGARFLCDGAGVWASSAVCGGHSARLCTTGQIGVHDAACAARADASRSVPTGCIYRC